MKVRLSPSQPASLAPISPSPTQNIMKLAQGEYVALEKVENAYSTCPIVSQIFIHGESLQDHLLAVVVPDPIQLVDWAHKLGITSHTVNPADQKAIEKLVADKRVKELIQSQMDKEAKKQGLKGFETAKKIFLSAEMFSPDNGLLTPTLKIRRCVGNLSTGVQTLTKITSHIRKEAYNKYKEELDALYAAGPKADSKF
jgi:long-chain acyl-CoA synthetase